MCKSNLPKHFRPKKGLMTMVSLVTSCLGGWVSPIYADNMVCYTIADNDRYGNKDYIMKIDASTGQLIEEPIPINTMKLDASTGQLIEGPPINTIKDEPKPTNTTKVEASAFDCEGGQLYVVDGGILGTLDIDDTGVFTPIGTGLGTGIGIKGAISINDIDGLAFDCSTMKLYGTHRIEEDGNKMPNNDLLVEINPVTGKIVKNAFGKNKDYVPITGSRTDIDDIAWDPGPKSIDDNDEEFYVIANEGMGKNSYLGNLQKSDASVSIIGGILTGQVVNERVTRTVNDIESLAFASEPNADGTFNLYGTTGDSIGAKTPSTGNRLYKLIGKGNSGSVPIGPYQALARGEKPQHDFEALACRSEIPTCVLYAVHDEARMDSQIIRIDPFKADQTISIQMFGPLHKNVDIEGLVIVPSKPGDHAPGKFYGFSGGDGLTGAPYYVPQGAVYQITREPQPGDDPQVPAGQLTLLGLTGFLEVSAAGLQYIDNDHDGIMDATQAWGWARKNHHPNQAAYTLGPITVDLGTAVGTKEGPAVKVLPGTAGNVPFPDLESIAMSNDGKTLYGVQYVSKKPENPDYVNGTHLWAYNIATKKLTPQCLENGKVHPFVHAEVEGLEMQPNGLLLFAIYYKGDWGFGAMDPKDCTIKATRTFTSDDYFYDIESIEWPADECRGRSWLYSGSGDVIVTPLPEYEDVSAHVVDAMGQAVGEEGSVESGDGLLTVYIGDQTFVTEPTIFDEAGAIRVGTRSAEEECPVTDAKVSTDMSQLTFKDCNGVYDVRLNPVPVSRAALLRALNDLGQATMDDDGSVSVVFADGTTVNAKLSSQVENTGTLQLGADISAQLESVGDVNGDGIEDFKIIYSTGHSQILFVQKSE